MPTQAC